MERKVYHKRFGYGFIVDSYELDDGHLVAVVNFEDIGIKEILVNYLNVMLMENHEIFDYVITHEPDLNHGQLTFVDDLLKCRVPIEYITEDENLIETIKCYYSMCNFWQVQ